MSQEYVDRLRDAYDAFDTGGVEAILDRVAPDLQVRGRASSPDRETLVGGEGIVELVRLNLEAFDNLELEPLEFIDRDELIVVVLMQRVRGRSSGVPLECETVHVWNFSDGHAAQMRIFANRERALEVLDAEAVTVCRRGGTSEALAAVLAFKRAQLLGAAERVEPVSDVAGGLAVSTPSLPSIWELNLLLAPEEADRDIIERLLEVAERVQGAAGLSHRKLRLSGPGSTDDGLEDLARAAGWNVDRELVMVRRRAPDRKPTARADVREVSADELAAAEDPFLMSEPHGRDPAVRRQLIAQMARWESAAKTVKRLGIVEDERVVGWCRLYDDQGVTEIDGVGVLPERRGSGLGRALLEGVLARVPRDRLLFLCADTDDWPKDLYGRLGFDVVGERLGATKAPQPDHTITFKGVPS